MKIKLTVYTDPKGEKHYITSFDISATMSHFRTRVIKPDGSVESGPKIPIECMPGQPDSKCQEIEAELVLP